MEAVILIGIQGAGKSSFCRDRFYNTHVRINLDMLKTRHREKLLLEACIAAKQRFVVDNTNPSREDRRRYIEPAKAAGFTVVGYYLQSKVADCHERNQQRTGRQVVPVKAILGAAVKTGGKVAPLINSSVSFLKATRTGTLTAEATEVSRSRKISTCTVRVTNDAEELVALFQGTAYVKDESFPPGS